MPHIYLKLMSLCSGLVFFAPVALLLRTTKGITLSEFFILQMVVSVMIVLLEVPTGVIADKIGYKKTIIISQILVFFTRILFLLANNFWVFLLEAIVEAVAICFSSGTSSAYLYELLGDEEYAIESSKIGRFSTVGFIVSTLTYSFMYRSLGINGLIVATAVCNFVSIICALKLTDLKTDHTVAKPTLIQSIKDLKYLKSFKAVFIITNNGLISVAFLVINFFYIAKLTSLGILEELIGPLILGYAFVQMLTPKLLHLLKGYSEKSKITGLFWDRWMLP